VRRRNSRAWRTSSPAPSIESVNALSRAGERASLSKAWLRQSNTAPLSTPPENGTPIGFTARLYGKPPPDLRIERFYIAAADHVEIRRSVSRGGSKKRR